MANIKDVNISKDLADKYEKVMMLPFTENTLRDYISISYNLPVSEVLVKYPSSEIVARITSLISEEIETYK